jgi:hypothetical protein
MPDPDARIGLCLRCVHARHVPHPRGGDGYWMCAKSGEDPRFPKYPPLPVRACAGFTPRESGDEPAP